MGNAHILVTGDFNIPSEYQSDGLVHLRTPRNNEEIVHHLKGIRHYIVGGPEYIDHHMLMCAHDLKHVVVMGTGTNSFIDLDAARLRNIHVDNTPGLNAEIVAEFALGMLIASLANSFFSYQNLLEGGWHQTPHRTLSESKIGIVGMGNIGKNLSQKIRAISAANISYCSRTRKLDLERKLGLEFMDVECMAHSCDAIILAVTYTPQTHHIISSKVLQSTRNGLILLNLSNPKTVDPTVLKECLENGNLQFAFFDGYYSEWIQNQGSQEDPYGLLKLGSEKFVATSHIAAQSRAAISQILQVAFKKIALWDQENSICDQAPNGKCSLRTRGANLFPS